MRHFGERSRLFRRPVRAGPCPLLPEPVEVLVVVPIGAAIKLIGKGLRTGQVHEPILDADQLQQLTATPGRRAGAQEGLGILKGNIHDA